jgi:hypothetical protein
LPPPLLEFRPGLVAWRGHRLDTQTQDPGRHAPAITARSHRESMRTAKIEALRIYR